jgi:hypothetical protein
MSTASVPLFVLITPMVCSWIRPSLGAAHQWHRLQALGLSLLPWYLPAMSHPSPLSWVPGPLSCVVLAHSATLLLLAIFQFILLSPH